MTGLGTTVAGRAVGGEITRHDCAVAVVFITGDVALRRGSYTVGLNSGTVALVEVFQMEEVW